MASTFGLLSEKHFLCSLCRKIFTNPVTIPCGHSFCLSCLSHFWSKHLSRYCPHCKRLFAERPNLSINHVLADVSEKYRKIKPPKAPEEEATVVYDVEQMVQERLQKIERLKSSLEQQKSSYLREVRESQKTFSALVSAMEKSHKAVVTAIEDRQREEEKRVEKLIKELEQEIQELRKDTTEDEPTLEDNKEPGDETEQVTVTVTQTPVCPPEMKDWSKVTVEADPCIGVTRRALSELAEKIKTEVNRLSKSELKRIEKYTVDISLSAKTAHPALSVSDDRKQVRHTDKLQEVSENPKRFDRVANILAKESFSNGRYYWEVEVGDKIEWNLGAARQSINRKGKFTVCPNNGFWTLSLKATGQYLANSSPVTHLALDHRPKRVGVFLDYTEGRVSFYCGESGAHIYTFTDKFTDRLHPFFSPGRLHGGKNAAPLSLSSSFCSI